VLPHRWDREMASRRSQAVQMTVVVVPGVMVMAAPATAGSGTTPAPRHDRRDAVPVEELDVYAPSRT